MTTGLYKKGLVLGIIILFFGAGVIPSIGGTIRKNDNIDVGTLYINDGLVGYWNFDKGEGNIAYDFIGENHGEITGASWTDESISGYALSFDGDYDYVIVPDSPDLNFADTNEFTLETWIKWDGTPNPDSCSADIINKASSDGGYILSISNTGRVHFIMIDEYYNSYRVISKTLDTGWHCVVAVWDGYTQYIHTDGKLDNSTVREDFAVIDTSKYYLEFGNNFGYTDSYHGFRGIIDEIFIYERALNAEEVMRRYQKPFVEITNPKEGEKVKGLVQVQGTSNDINGTVETVEVKIDNGDWSPADGTTSWNYEWNTETVEDVQHSIYARSKDNEGFYSDETSVMVNVNNLGEPPIVFISSPVVGGSYGSELEIEGICHDDDGDETIEWVKISIDDDSDDADWGVADGTVEWSYDLDTSGFDEGWHTIYAKANDNNDLTGWAESVTFVVDNTPPSSCKIVRPREAFLHLHNLEVGYIYFATVVIGPRGGIEVFVEIDKEEKPQIERVEFWAGNEIKGIGAWSTFKQYYTWPWDETLLGPCTLTAKVYDKAGNIATDEINLWYFNIKDLPGI